MHGQCGELWPYLVRKECSRASCCSGGYSSSTKPSVTMGVWATGSALSRPEGRAAALLTPAEAAVRIRIPSQQAADHVDLSGRRVEFVFFSIALALRSRGSRGLTWPIGRRASGWARSPRDRGGWPANSLP